MATKILVATKLGQGIRKNDYSHSTEGEIVTFGSECDREAVDGKCGCRRALVGVDSRKAGTTFLCVERDLDLDALTDIILASLVAGGWYEKDDAKGREHARSDATDLLKIAAVFSLGSIVEKRGDMYGTRTPPEQKQARDDRKSLLSTPEDYIAFYGEERVKQAAKTNTLFVVKSLKGLRQKKAAFCAAVAAELRQRHGDDLVFILNEHPSLAASRVAADRLAGAKKGAWMKWTNGRQTAEGLVLSLNKKTVSMITSDGPVRVGIGGTFSPATPPKVEKIVVRTYGGKREAGYTHIGDACYGLLSTNDHDLLCRALKAPISYEKMQLNRITEVPAPAMKTTPTPNGGMRLVPTTTEEQDAAIQDEVDALNAEGITDIDEIARRTVEAAELAEAKWVH